MRKSILRWQSAAHPDGQVFAAHHPFEFEQALGSAKLDSLAQGVPRTRTLADWGCVRVLASTREDMARAERHRAAALIGTVSPI